MKAKRFKQIVKNRLKICKSTLTDKGKEYSRNGDRLHNFKKARASSPERALAGMWEKHLVSIDDMIEDVEIGKLPSEKVLDEKIKDSINYLLLLEGLVRERMEVVK